MSEGKEYVIRTVEDFRTVPVDKIAACLRDFNEYLEISAKLEAADSPLQMEPWFHWVDDGIDGVSAININVHHGAA